MMEMNDVIAYVLRIGVVISVILILVGTVLLFLQGSSNGFTIGELASTGSKINSSLFSFSDIVNGLLSYQGLDFMLIGIIVLIITPIARVIASVLSFMYERNWLYVVITLIVFIDIMVAIFVVPGLLGH
jgi:uncharacterized membrane protein